MIEFDRLETTVRDDEKKLKSLENLRDTMRERMSIWNDRAVQTEGYMLSFEAIGELIKELARGENTVPKADLFAFLRDHDDLIKAVEKLVTFLEMKTGEITEQPLSAAAETAQNIIHAQPVLVSNDGHAPVEEKGSTHNDVTADDLDPPQNFRVVKPDYSKVIIQENPKSTHDFLQTLKTPAPEERPVSAADQAAVDMTSPLHAGSLPNNQETLRTPAPVEQEDVQKIEQPVSDTQREQIENGPLVTSAEKQNGIPKLNGKPETQTVRNELRERVLDLHFADTDPKTRELMTVCRNLAEDFFKEIGCLIQVKNDYRAEKEKILRGYKKTIESLTEEIKGLNALLEKDDIIHRFFIFSNDATGVRFVLTVKTIARKQ